MATVVILTITLSMFLNREPFVKPAITSFPFVLLLPILFGGHIRKVSSALVSSS